MAQSWILPSYPDGIAHRLGGVDGNVKVWNAIGDHDFILIPVIEQQGAEVVLSTHGRIA